MTRFEIATFFQYASNMQFKEFYELEKILPEDSNQDYHFEFYLMRAQIKLITADISILEDLEKAKEIGGMPELSCLGRCWVPYGPNSFFVFDSREGALESFLKLLPFCEICFTEWFGEIGAAMVRQVKSEIYYFIGDLENALALASIQRQKMTSSIHYSMMAGYVIFRSSLGLGRIHQAEDSMRDIIRQANQSQDDGSGKSIYGIIRSWANLTTGWSGDSPRYNRSPDGTVIPVLDDREMAVKRGISDLSSTEQPFLEYARLNYKDAYHMRALYMDIYWTMDSFKARNLVDVEKHFKKAYKIVRNTGLIMPLVEYGKQIVPFFDMLQSNKNYSKSWISQISDLAQNYENNLNNYRD